VHLQIGQRLGGEGLEFGIVTLLAVALEEGNCVLVCRNLHIVVFLREVLALQLGKLVELLLVSAMEASGEGSLDLSASTSAFSSVEVSV